MQDHLTIAGCRRKLLEYPAAALGQGRLRRYSMLFKPSLTVFDMSKWKCPINVESKVILKFKTWPDGEQNQRNSNWRISKSVKVMSGCDKILDAGVQFDIFRCCSFQVFVSVVVTSKTASLKYVSDPSSQGQNNRMGHTADFNLSEGCFPIFSSCFTNLFNCYVIFNRYYLKMVIDNQVD